MQKRWSQLEAIAAELADLSKIVQVLSWDQQTYMPAGGGKARAEQLATVQRLIHERLTRPELEELLHELRDDPDVNGEPFRKAFLRELSRLYDQSVRIPVELVTEFTRVSSLAISAWTRAKQEDDFQLFAPHLKRIVELTRERADALGYATTRYDALCDLYEPGITRAELDPLFAKLRDRLVPLLQRILSKDESISDAPFRKVLDGDAQFKFCQQVITQLGFDPARGRLDLSAHPFTISFSSGDVRLTTNIVPDDLRVALYSAIHEAGHGMYEQGIPERFERTPVGNVPSLGLHESQSRLWENVIGRSRAFWTYFLPHLKEAFPGQFDDCTVEMIYQAVNRVTPSFIRTEADEVTYNLHIMVRYELEQALIEGSLSVADLPAAWNSKMEEYLGIRPPTMREGVLQDIHWATGAIGYFPTYTLGTLLSVQLYDAALQEHPGIVSEVAAGDFSTLRNWMQKHIYDAASLYTPKELLRRTLGTGYDAEPFLTYLERKYGELYAL